MSIIVTLLDLGEIRAFPNQFHVKVEGTTDSSYAQNFHFYASKIDLGAYNLSVDRLSSTQHTLLKKATVPDIVSITIKEDHNWSTLQFFYNWYTQAYYDPARRVFISGKNGKRKTFKILALKPPYGPANIGEGQGEVGMTIIVKDALLVSDIPLPSFNYESSEPVDFTFKIQSDDISILFSEERL